MKIGISYIGKYEGEWWLPGQEESTIRGTLEIMNDGDIYFQTFQQFVQSYQLFGIEEYKEIHGLVMADSDNQEYRILLFDLLQDKWVTGRLVKTRFFVYEINLKLKSLFFTVLKKNMVEEKPWPALSC